MKLIMLIKQLEGLLTEGREVFVMDDYEKDGVMYEIRRVEVTPENKIVIVINPDSLAK